MQEALETIVQTCQDSYADAPERPKNTCPDIDDAIRQIRSVMDAIKDARRLLSDTDARDPFWHWNEDDLSTVIDMLEDLRDKNADLRENGTHFFKTVKAIEQMATEALQSATA